MMLGLLLGLWTAHAAPLEEEARWSIAGAGRLGVQAGEAVVEGARGTLRLGPGGVVLPARSAVEPEPGLSLCPSPDGWTLGSGPDCITLPRAADAGPVDFVDLPGGPLWSEADGARLVDEKGRAIPVFPGPGALAFTGRPDPVVYVAHPDLGLIGLARPNRAERAVRVGFAVSDLFLVDWDGDGCRELLASGEDQVVAYDRCEGGARLAESLPADPEPVSPEPPSEEPPADEEALPAPRDVPKVSWFGLKIPKHNLGTGLQSSGIPHPARTMSFAFGGAMGSAPFQTWLQIPFSPSGSLIFERGGARYRSFWSLDSSPLLIWATNAGNGIPGWHLFNLSRGIMVGSPHLRMGAYGTVGLINIGAGLRFVWTPFESRRGTLTGLEARMVFLNGNHGHGGLYVVVTGPRGRSRQPAVARGPVREGGPFVCQRLAFGVGGAASSSGTQQSWEFLGQDGVRDWSGSPVLSAACETGGKTGGLVIGVNTAPFLTHRVPLFDASDTTLAHMASVTLGPVLGTDLVRVGPHVTGGVWTLSAGLRAVVTPVELGGVHHGLELRADVLAPSSQAFQGMALYTFWFDPRRGVRD